MRLLIAMPSYGGVATDCARSLAMMMFYIGRCPPDGMEWVAIETMSSSNLPQLRHDLAVSALQKRNASHILWVDSDMAFPKESFHRLLARDKEIIGANYPRRLGEHFSAATDLDGEPFKASSTGIEQAGVIGFGLLLTRISVFDDGYSFPLFGHHEENYYCTEDVTFCRKVRARGHEIWVDHDLSREVRHIGSISLGHEHMEAATS